MLVPTAGIDIRKDREEKFAYHYWVPPKMFRGEHITGTHGFAYFPGNQMDQEGQQIFENMPASRTPETKI